MKKSIAIILFILSTQLITAQKKCYDVKRLIKNYQSFIASDERDIVYYTQDSIKYSKNRADKKSKDYYDTAITVLPVFRKTIRTEQGHMEALKKELPTCKD